MPIFCGNTSAECQNFRMSDATTCPCAVHRRKSWEPKRPNTFDLLQTAEVFSSNDEMSVSTSGRYATGIAMLTQNEIVVSFCFLKVVSWKRRPIRPDGSPPAAVAIDLPQLPAGPNRSGQQNRDFSGRIQSPKLEGFCLFCNELGNTSAVCRSARNLRRPLKVIQRTL